MYLVGKCHLKRDGVATAESIVTYVSDGLERTKIPFDGTPVFKFLTV